MKKLWKYLGAYIKQNAAALFLLIACSLIFSAVFLLYSLPAEAVLYAALLCFVLLLIYFCVGFFQFVQKHRQIERVRQTLAAGSLIFPPTSGLIERDYQLLASSLEKCLYEMTEQKDASYSEMMDYYTLWAHQIKTPIAAMRLVLQSSHAGDQGELLEQLFKIEQYVEMVLQYLRMESMGADLLIRQYPLDDLCKQAIRKYSKSFIRKHLHLKFEPLNQIILTDEKWLVFVLEQILSNAIKYTAQGCVSIYMDPEAPMTLVIEDTGIGIEAEDLPRVFEKGFTGYNGRADQRSTGIGLYLCKRILTRLSHTIQIESKPGYGTTVKIGLDCMDLKIE